MYDALNRTISKSVPHMGKSTYVYDLAGSEAGTYGERTTDPKGNITEKIYDKAGRLWNVKTGTETTVYAYYPNGTKKSITYPDGTIQSYSYDNKNQIVSLTNKGSNGSTLSYYTYTYDGAGNQLTKTGAKGTTEYSYDALNRLSTVKEPGEMKTSYTYDRAGNWITEKKEKENQSGLIQYVIDPSGHVAGSVVDYLKAQKQDSSYAARKEIAKELGIKNYKGSAIQNTQMLKMLQKQKEEKKVVADNSAKKVAEEKAAETKRVAGERKKKGENLLT
ncbi:YD repeat-containing protein [Anaerotaenia torta]|uniref:DUF3597 family protein n=1 Tax=Anaerotaenia torta TaxID=433293 RepID=UPI003D199677